jgi:undecaprenyl-diphosphatase
MSPLLLLLVLAVIQGLSEFLPISSSGHLVIAKQFLPGGGQLVDGVGIEIMLHLGTLVAVLIHYRKRIGQLIAGVFGKSSDTSEQRDYLGKLIVATIPTVIAGLFVFDTDSFFFVSPVSAAYGLLFTAVVLLSSKFASKTGAELSSPKAMLIGLSQAIAILPGISRSGSTIIMARHLKIGRQQAEDFSFLMAIPTILGAAIFKLPDADFSKISVVEISSSLVLSCLVGLLALRVVHSVVQKHQMHLFAPYCVVMALVVLTKI